MINLTVYWRLPVWRHRHATHTWKMIVVTDPEKRHQVADAATSKNVVDESFQQTGARTDNIGGGECQFYIKNRRMAQGKHYPHLDLGILASHICLAAADEGLGSCMLGWCDEKKWLKHWKFQKVKRSCWLFYWVILPKY